MVRAQQDAGLRTGATIDAYERMYFGLFPDIPTFDSARVALEPDSSLTFLITRTGATDTTVRITGAQATQLRQVLDTYEHADLRDLVARPKGEAAVRASLVRENIILPHRPLAPDDTHILVTIPTTTLHPDAAPDDTLALRMIGLADSMVIALPQMTDSTGSVQYGSPVLLPMRDLRGFRYARTASFSNGFLISWGVTTAALSVAFSNMGSTTNTGTHYDATEGDPGKTILYAASLAVPAGLLGGVLNLLGGVDTEVALESHPVLRRQQIERVATARAAMPPELRSSSPASAPDDLDQSLRTHIDVQHALRRRDRARGVEGWRLGLDLGIPLYYVPSKTYGASLAVQLMCGIPLDAAAPEPAWIIRPAVGLGTTTFPQVDLALIHAPGRGVWYQAFLSWEAYTDELGSYMYACGEDVIQRNARDHMFSGIGVGFRIGESTALDLTARMSWGSIIRTHCSLEQYIGDDPEPSKSFVILRGTLSIAL
jgi:hypothetical protein